MSRRICSWGEWAKVGWGDSLLRTIDVFTPESETSSVRHLYHHNSGYAYAIALNCLQPQLIKQTCHQQQLINNMKLHFLYFNP